MGDRIQLEDYDGEKMLFSCRSFTDPEKVYCLTLDRQKMLVTCDCLGALRWQKVWHLLLDSSDMCCHQRLLRLTLRGHLHDAGLI